MEQGSSYLRFSRPEQALGDSERRQLELTKKWAAELGVHLRDQYRDLGISGFRGQNRRDATELARFLKLVEDGEIKPGEWLFLECLDRLTREEILPAVGLFTSLLEAGIV